MTTVRTRTRTTPVAAPVRTRTRKPAKTAKPAAKATEVECPWDFNYLKACPEEKRPEWFYGTAVFRKGTTSGAVGIPQEFRPGFLGRVLRQPSGGYRVWRWLKHKKDYLDIGTRTDWSAAWQALDR